MENIENHEVQILFTNVIKKGGNIVFEDYAYNVNDDNYFYPASSVKFPIAVLALEKLSQYPSISISTPFLALKDSVKTTIASEVEKIFSVSDNVAYNKLYDFLGFESINDSLKAKGLNACISHKLEDGDQNNYPVQFFSDNTITLEILNHRDKNVNALNMNRITKGVGYIKGDSLVNEPMDFSRKNYLPLTTLHDIMKRVIFPDQFTERERFHLSKLNRDFLLKSMKMLPRDAGYHSDHYYDSYVKFLVFGDDKNNIPNYIDVYNKVGYAYGYLTDSAYIVDSQNDKSYIITATIHVNENRIYNDGVYEYDEVGIPFLAELGRHLTQIDLKD